MKKYICLIVATFAISACTLWRTSEPARFYTFTTPEVSQIRGPAHVTTVAIENVTVPQAINRPQIVMKYKNSNMMMVSEFDRWIDEPANSLPVVISENMNMYAKNISARPTKNSVEARNAKYILSVDFVRFETEINGKITISAWWTLTNNRGDIIAQKKMTQTADTPELNASYPNYDAIVATQSKLLAKLSYKIADVISDLK